MTVAPDPTRCPHLEETMRLYHYTGSEHTAGIQRHGITLGGIPIPAGDGHYRPLRGWQWLTDDADWRQGWATMQDIHCDRTEYRFEVVIPKAHRQRLYRWQDVASRFGFRGSLLQQFAAEGGDRAEHWYVFDGRIPPGWLRRLEARRDVAA